MSNSLRTAFTAATVLAFLSGIDVLIAAVSDKTCVKRCKEVVFHGVAMPTSPVTYAGVQEYNPSHALIGIWVKNPTGGQFVDKGVPLQRKNCTGGSETCGTQTGGIGGDQEFSGASGCGAFINTGNNAKTCSLNEC